MIVFILGVRYFSRWSIHHIAPLTEIRQHTVPSRVLQGQVY